LTEVGTGGVKITRWSKLRRFHRDYDKLTFEQRDLVDSKLQDLATNPRPPGLKFEKLKGYTNPDIYTIHVTGSYKVSMEIAGSVATLRRVGDHDDIDRAP
jgi:mRNA-degrading endonuclease RelE of RelBE toxin-antitoxin system